MNKSIELVVVPTNMTNNNVSTITTINSIVLVCLNVSLIPLAWFILRVIFKPKQLEAKDQPSEDEHSSLVMKDANQDKPQANIRYIHEGESAGDYLKNWTSTYDLVFVIIMACFLIILCTITSIYVPSLWHDWIFWLKQLAVFLIVMIVMFCAGLVCRHYCQIDDKGYIMTNRSSHFKVNYTKKVQHLLVHMAPLLTSMVKSQDSMSHDAIYLCWGYYVMLLTNLVLIKPLRERSKILMIQFNCMDRPEDRPHTLFWVTVGNMIPSNILTVFYRWLYPFTGLDGNLVYIYTLVNTVGDGLAEPVGIYFGKHRYKTRGCFNRTKYERSFEGSSCVFITTVVVTSIFSFAFRRFVQVWITILFLPFIMAIVEATSPHTCDSGFINGFGGLTIFITAHLNLKWI